MVGGFITDNLSWRWAFYVSIGPGITHHDIAMDPSPSSMSLTSPVPVHE